MFKRFLSSAIDFAFVFLFTVLLWAALDGATGTHFDMYFVSEHDAILTLGMKPTRPETGYGYIQYIQEPTALSLDNVSIKSRDSLEIISTNFP